ncbi:MAG: radical SAM protein [Proteobacteria bacterium]|nr:MAG: radical SAM protein [Pseudomonadota bacterium]
MSLGSQNDLLKINEIFYSIQGETTYVGNPTVFVRTTACNLRCTYCDTKYSYYEGENQALSEIIKVIESHKTKYVCITGGEPLLQKPVHVLMKDLSDRDFLVSLETSGSKSIRDVDPRVKIILDVKTPDSGAADSFLMDNLSLVNQSTEFKFVICSEKDFEWSEEFCRQHDLFEKQVVLYSPSFGQISERWLAEKILQNNSSARLQLQLHKYIWSPEKRGV